MPREVWPCARSAFDVASSRSIEPVADASSGELLGVHIIGVLATEQIAESVVARHFEATALELADVVHAHPTLAEATMEAMFATDGRSIHF